MVQGLNSNNYQISNTGLTKEELKQKAINSQTAVADNFENTSAGQIISGQTKDPNMWKKTLLLTGPLYFLNKYIIDSSMGGGNGGILASFAKLGDKISSVLPFKNIKVAPKVEKAKNYLHNNQLTKYFTSDYQAIPKSGIVKSTVNESLSGKYIENLRSKIKDIASQSIDDIKANTKISQSVKTALQDLADPNKVTNIEEGQLLNIAKELVENNVGGNKISIAYNKAKASMGDFGKSAIGKVLSKGTLKTQDLLLFGGDMLGVYFAASGILQSAKEAKEAPKGEKLSTFMHVFSEQYLGLLLLKPSASILYKLAGNKYRGMSTEGREALKTLVKTSNEAQLSKEAIKVANIQKNLLLKGVDKNKVAQLANKSLQEAKELQSTLKNEGAKLKFWERPLKFAGKLLSIGLDDIKKSKHIKLPMGGKIKLPSLKGFASGFGRLLIVLMVIQPILDKPLKKLIHKIFGTPETYLKKQEQNTKNTTNQDSLSNQASEQNQNQAQAPDEKTTQPQSPQTNLIERYTNQDPVQNGSIVENNTNTAKDEPQTNGANALSPLEANQEPLPASKLNKKDKNRYIPSIDVNNTSDKQEDKELNKQLEQSLKEVDAVVASAKKALTN